MGIVERQRDWVTECRAYAVTFVLFACVFIATAVFSFTCSVPLAGEISVGGFFFISYCAIATVRLYRSEKRKLDGMETGD